MATSGRDDLMAALAAPVPKWTGAGRRQFAMRIWRPHACDEIDKLLLLQRERSERIGVPHRLAVTGSGQSPGGTPRANPHRADAPVGCDQRCGIRRFNDARISDAGMSA